MTLLPSGCAVYATAAAVFFENHGINCRLISFRLQRESGYERHVTCLFMVNNRLRSYDPQGTRTLKPGLSLKSKPHDIAEAILDACYYKKHRPKESDARWY